MDAFPSEFTIDAYMEGAESDNPQKQKCIEQLQVLPFMSRQVVTLADLRLRVFRTVVTETQCDDQPLVLCKLPEVDPELVERVMGELSDDHRGFICEHRVNCQVLVICLDPQGVVCAERALIFGRDPESSVRLGSDGGDGFGADIDFAWTKGESFYE